MQSSQYIDFILYQDDGEILVIIILYDMIERYLRVELDEIIQSELMQFGIIVHQLGLPYYDNIELKKSQTNNINL
jgi:hypothetical protein